MIHLRLLVPPALVEKTLDVLTDADSVSGIAHIPGASVRPEGDLVLADVAREDASPIIGALRDIGLAEEGCISLETVESAISARAREAEEAAPGLPTDAVVWEEIEASTQESTELSLSYLAFMVIAMLIGAVGVMTDSPVLIIGAMVVGPEFGPLAGLCVAVVQRQRSLAWRSLNALAVGFALGIGVTYIATLVMRGTGIAPDAVAEASRPLTQFISDPGPFSAIVAFLAGVAGILSLTSAKSGALVGVLISVTTIPAAANIGVAAAYAEWPEFAGALQQLVLNLVMLILAGLLTLLAQRRLAALQQRRRPARPVGASESRTREGERLETPQ